MRAQRAMQALWYLDSSAGKPVFLHPDVSATGLAILDSASALTRLKVNLAAFKEPQILVINQRRRDPQGVGPDTVFHHAILVMAYNEKAVVAYDPNYPESLVWLPTERRPVPAGGGPSEVEVLAGTVVYQTGPHLAPGTVLVSSTPAEPASFRVFTTPGLGSEANFQALLKEADDRFRRSDAILLSIPRDGETIDDRVVNVQGSFTTLDPETTRGQLWSRGLVFPLDRSGESGFTELASPAFAGRYPLHVMLAEPAALETAWHLNSAVKRLTLENTEPPADLLVTMTWDTPGTDLDLYLETPSGDTLCWNCGSSDGGAFRTDDRYNGGPEYAFVTTHPRWGHIVGAGKYKVRVHWYENAAPDVQETLVTVHVIWRERVLGGLMETVVPERVCRYTFRMRAWNPANSDPDATGPDWYEVATATFDPRVAEPVEPSSGCGLNLAPITAP